MCCQHRGAADLANVSMLKEPNLLSFPTFSHSQVLPTTLSSMLILIVFDYCVLESTLLGWMQMTHVLGPRWHATKKTDQQGFNLCCRKRPNMGTVISSCSVGSTGHLGPR